MKKFLYLACCSVLFFTGCSKASYFQSTDLVEEKQIQASDEEIVEELVPEKIFVQVSGAVAKPGVYELTSGSRVYAAIEAAGGLLDSADDTNINQAAVIIDGEKIIIYTEEEAEEIAYREACEKNQQNDDGLININTASAADLKTLPGIGEAKANQIVSYRQENGAFKSIEDIKNVSGIGDGIFEQINSLIKI